jgi:hypothetical protein
VRALARLPATAALLWMALHPGPASTEPLWREDALRFRVGLKVFPAVLGALDSLAEKRSPEGDLNVVVVCQGSGETARQAASDLLGIGEVRGLPLRVTTLSIAALDQYQGAPLGAILVASVGVGAKRLHAWSERFRALVFSPFFGDVEAGAVAGIHVSDQILPYINVPQSRRAGVRFKAFLLRVARRYE